MSLGTLIEAAIGLITIYLALSIVVTASNEWLATLLNTRSENLKNAVRAMLGDDVRQEVYDDPLVKALGLGEAPGTNAFTRLTRMGNGEPDWIPSDLFAETTVASWKRALEEGGDALDTAEKFEAALAKLKADPTSVPDKLKPLLALADRGVTKVEDLQGRVSTWFDGVMGEASSLYRKKIQRYGFWFGMGLCIALNADTVRFVDVVWQEDMTREALTAWSAKAVEADELPTEVPDELLAHVPLGWNEAEVCRTVGLMCPADVEAPAGWSLLLAVFMKIAGIVTTAGAVAQGAPFWFSALKQISSLRSSKT